MLEQIHLWEPAEGGTPLRAGSSLSRLDCSRESRRRLTLGLYGQPASIEGHQQIFGLNRYPSTCCPTPLTEFVRALAFLPRVLLRLHPYKNKFVRTTMNTGA